MMGWEERRGGGKDAHIDVGADAAGVVDAAASSILTSKLTLHFRQSKS